MSIKSEAYTNGTLTETILFIGAHYEVTNPSSSQVVTKYYFAGITRIAMRKDGILNYILGDYLGSTSVVTDAAGAIVSQQLSPLG